jgi:glycosyltransferase involved in cell wall biosynthesis
VALARFKLSTSWLPRVAHVIAPTEATKRDVVALRGVAPERISVVPYGVDARFRPLSAERRASVRAALSTASPHVLLSVSTGDPYKNLPATLQVTAALRASGVDVALLRVGRPLDAEQRALAHSLGLRDRIVEAGRVSDERLIELYGAADALLFPSFWEGFGWPPLEAMACGTPVIASNCAPLVEVVGEAALLAAPNDIARLTKAAAAVLTMPELSEGLRRRGVERAAQFPWTRTIDGFAATYAAVAEASQRGRRACAA